METMLLTIIILNYQTYELTINCIKSILATQQDINYRIIVVDDCSPNMSLEAIQKWLDSVEPLVPISIIRTLKNNGYSSALNLGVKEAIKSGTKFIAVLNNDLIFEKEYFSVLISAAIKEPSIAFWGGAIKGSDNIWQESYKTYRSNIEFVLSKRPFSAFYKKKDFSNVISYSVSENIIKFSGMVSGCCFLFHSLLIEKIGFWDENIYLYHEEDAVAAKLKSVNLQCAIVPWASLIHLGSQTIGNGTPFQYYHRYISEIYVLKKYYGATVFQLFLLKIIANIGLFRNIHKREIRETYRKSFNKYYKSMMNESLS